MKQGKRVLTLAIAGMMAVGVFPAYGYAPTGPGVAQEQDKYDAETTARLQDNVLEYDEIALRVKEYNPTVSRMWDTYNDTKVDYEVILTELESQLDDRYKSVIKTTRDVVNKWDRNKTTTSTFRRYERQFTSGAQSAMIGYDTIRRNMATLETMVAMYQRQYDMYNRMAAQGMATQADVLGAQVSLLQAQSQLSSLQVQEDSVRRNLCLLLGYDPDSNPDIRPIPDFDMTRLDTMNLEADTVKAIGNNYTLIEQRTSSAGQTNDQISTRLKVIEEGDQKLSIEIQRLYQQVMDKKAALESAQTGFAAADKSFSAAQRQFSSGMISEVQYLGLQISYYQKKAAVEAANLDLWQAMENYDWGVMGFAAVE